MKRTPNSATVPATEARTQFGELMDEINDSSKVVAIEREDDPAVLLIAEETDTVDPPVSKHAKWFEQIRELHKRLAESGFDPTKLESPVDIIREFRDR